MAEVNRYVTVNLRSPAVSLGKGWTVDYSLDHGTTKLQQEGHLLIFDKQDPDQFVHVDKRAVR